MAAINYPYYEACFVIDGYSLSKDFDEIYLGWDNFLETDAQAKVKAVFFSPEETTNFYNWWEKETRRGVDPFIIKLDYFGEIKKFGVLQESPLVKKIKESQSEYEVSFDLRIIFGEEEIFNNAPVCEAKTVYIAEDTRENYIRFEAYDEEGDPFEYELQVPTAYGTLKGTLPAVLYTPDPGFKGEDCFSYIVKDYFNESEPCIVKIIVDSEARPDHVVRYEPTAAGSSFDEHYLYINGNFHYSFDNVNWKRGFGGRVTPYSMDKNLLLNYSFDTQEYWEQPDAAKGLSEIKDGVLKIYPGNETVQVEQWVTGFVEGDIYHMEMYVEEIKSGNVGLRLSNGTIYGTSEPGLYELELAVGPDTDTSAFRIGCWTGTEATVRYVKLFKKVDINNLWVASLDHSLNIEFPHVRRATIEKWGSRTDFRNYLTSQINLDPDGFSIGQDAGECKGTDFSRMFARSSIETMPVLNLPYLVNSRAMFANCTLKKIAFESGGWNDWEMAEVMFFNCDVEEITGLNTQNVSYFKSMFAWSDQLRCMSHINTTNAIDTSTMFNGCTSLVNPDAAAQTLIENGYNYSHPENCGITIQGIYKTSGTQACKTSNANTNCTSYGTYRCSYDSGSVEGSASFQWYVSGGTINGSSTNSTVSIDVSSAVSKNIYLVCVMTDSFDGATTNSGNYSFYHTRTYNSLNLTLPKSYSRINLKDFIDIYRGSETEIYVTNQVVNCAVYVSGIPASWNVTFTNNSELQGFRKGALDTNYTTNHGLYIESNNTVKLINNGSIRGAGGYGGKGGKGKDDTYTTTKNNSVTRQDDYPNNYWLTGHSCPDKIGWDGHGKVANMMPNPTTIAGISGEFTKGALVSDFYTGDSCIKFWHYKITRKWTTTVTHSRVGGAGGHGGYGAGYGYNAVWDGGDRTPQYGFNSTPAGGNKGGGGGYGGWWGNTGNTGGTGYGGGAVGTRGFYAAPAIRGKAYLKAGSVTGNVSGTII